MTFDETTFASESDVDKSFLFEKVTKNGLENRSVVFPADVELLC